MQLPLRSILRDQSSQLLLLCRPELLSWHQEGTGVNISRDTFTPPDSDAPLLTRGVQVGEWVSWEFSQYQPAVSASRQRDAVDLPSLPCPHWQSQTLPERPDNTSGRACIPPSSNKPRGGLARHHVKQDDKPVDHCVLQAVGCRSASQTRAAASHGT
jgi:hypothetical protein